VTLPQPIDKKDKIDYNINVIKRWPSIYEGFMEKEKQK